MRKWLALLLLPAAAFASDTTIRVNASTDPATRDTLVTTRSLEQAVGRNFMDPSAVSVFIGGIIHADGRQDCYLDVTYTSNGWKHLDRAIDIDAVTLPLAPQDQRVAGPGKTLEHLRVVLSRSYLDQHIDSGLAITLRGKDTDASFKVPAVFVHDFLAIVDSNLPGKPTSLAVRERPHLGAQLVPLQAPFAAVLGLPATLGMLVVAVAPGGIADAAGLQQGDVLLKAGSQDTNADADVIKAEVQLVPGTTLQLWRAGHPLTLQTR